MSEEIQKPDVDVLLGLLQDYSEKLEARVEAKQRTGFLFGIIVALGCLTSIFALLYFLLNPAIAKERDSLLIRILQGFGAALPLCFSLITVLQLRQRFSRQAQEIYRLRKSLETLVRRGSQIEDRGRADFTRRIALDLRLAEAEAALKYSPEPWGASVTHAPTQLPDMIGKGCWLSAH